MKIIKSIPAFVLIPLSLSGCVSLFPESGPGPKEILLESSKTTTAPMTSGQSPFKKAILAVEQPTTPAFLATRQIAVRRLEGGLAIQDQVSGFIWHDTPSHQLAFEMQQALMSQNIFKGVVPGSMNETSTYKLISHCSDATLDLTQAHPKVVLTLTTSLWHSAPQTLLRQKVFTYAIDISDQNPTTIQKAFGEMLANYTTDLTRWVGE